jgi:predicted transcriptional regulator
MSKMAMEKGRSSRTSDPIAEEYATSGPLTRLFENPTARVLDQALLVGRMEQTISMLRESTNLSYKTVEKVIDKLINEGVMGKGRKIGNAQTYVFRTENHLSTLITCADKMQKEHIAKTLEPLEE